MENRLPPSGSRIHFAGLRLENIYRHFAWNNDPELNRLDSETPFAEESFGVFKHRFERLVRHPAPSVIDFEIYAGDDLIGVAYLADISWHHGHCSVGVTIGDRDYWGKGYGKEALKLLLRFCFETLGLHRVTAEAFAYNDAWRRLVEGTGFSMEGVDRDYLFRDEKYYDRLRFGLLASEFRAGRGCRVRRSYNKTDAA